MQPQVTENGPLHSKCLCKNMASASGGANNMHPISWLSGSILFDPPDARAIKFVMARFP